MASTIDITIPVDADVAAGLSHEPRRAAMGRVVSRLLRREAGYDPLVEAMERLSA